MGYFSEPFWEKLTTDKPLRLELLDADEPDSRTAHTAEKQLDTISFNAGSEERFCNLICALLDTGALTAREAIIEASFELDISPETAKRYLSKHSARRARFEIADGTVRCRAHDHDLRRARRADRAPASRANCSECGCPFEEHSADRAALMPCIGCDDCHGYRE